MDAYSEDLRRKIVEAVHQRGMGKCEAARTFGVRLSSVKRYVKAAQEGRSLSAGKAPGKRPKLSESAKRLLEADVEASEDLGYELALPVARHLKALYPTRGGDQVGCVAAVTLAAASGRESRITSP